MSGHSDEVTVRTPALRSAAGTARALAQRGIDATERLGSLVSHLPDAMGHGASADGFARFAARWAQNYAGKMGELTTVAAGLEAAANHYDKIDAAAAAAVGRAQKS
ncbi:hypothetical protein Rhe02_41310 [Rhizocola hellebori]|uniref:Uncharacterized protein n=1 Tax=Rhizocola hellebori TaxID=1392758 RepID=A0A8J3Q9S2_9ACTN|nr:WXG100 family type VII secretion target [Rhizocola hellebori]GIH06064.1 hypothetical protein Rhe02_41310 [Rhizocola hellebori]